MSNKQPKFSVGNIVTKVRGNAAYALSSDVPIPDGSVGKVVAVRSRYMDQPYGYFQYHVQFENAKVLSERDVANLYEEDCLSLFSK